MKKLISLLVLVLISTLLVFAQAPGSNKSTILLESDPPQPVASFSVSAQVSGISGTRTLYYWIVARYPIGNAIPAGPALVRSAPDTMTGGNFVRVSWLGVTGATSYDVLRTVTPTLPNGACNCSIATAVTTTTVNNTSDALGGYTVSAAQKASVSISLNNSAFSTPRLVISPNTQIFPPLISGLTGSGGLIYDSATDTVSVASTSTGALLWDTTNKRLNFYRQTPDIFGPIIFFVKRGRVGNINGTPTAPNSELGAFNFTGWDGATNGSGAVIAAQANENFALNQWGSRLEFRTTTVGTNVSVPRMIVDQDGIRAYGVTFANLAAAANGTQIYCTDCTQAIPCAAGGTGAWALRINGAWSCTGGAAVGGAAYNTIQDETVAQVQRTTVNFTGAGVTCADNAPNTRTDCTIPAQNITSTGAYAALPGACASGDLYIPTDSVFTLLRCTAGNVWVPFLDGKQATAVIDNDYAWVNQGGASVAAAGGTVYLEGPANAGISWRVRKKAAPAVPYTVVSAMIPWQVQANSQQTGLIFRESGTSKLYSFGIATNIAGTQFYKIVISRWTNETTFSANVAATGDFYGSFGKPLWLKMQDTGAAGVGNLVFSYSFDGIKYVQLASELNTTFMAAAPNEIGFGVCEQSNSSIVGLTVASWSN